MADEPLAFRDTEVFALGRALNAHRLVVLTGPPGIGKSAIAAAFAGQRRRGKLETTFACDLEGARAAIDIVHEVARVLGLATSAGADAPLLTERVGRALAARRRPLVVLDDVDRCRVALATLLPQWLRDAPTAAFLVTARGRLGVAAEHRLEIGPLETPAAREREPDVIAASPAVQLFARRAAAARPGFRVTATNARTVATIVRKLEGIPLAIELSASRLVALSEKDIADLLGERLDLLEDERGERSIRSAFALSWEELGEEDAQLLAACSCFRGGFLLDAACAVADGQAPSPRTRLRVARGLERLVEASLVRVDDGEQRRYTLPETLRVFAEEKLAELPDAAQFDERHAHHYAGLRARTPPLPLDVMAAERKNLERAFDRSLRARDPRGAGALLAYAPVALARGPLAPFVERTSHALADLELAPDDHAALLLSRGLARIFQGKRDDALDDLELARREAGRAGAPGIEALATSKLALVIGLKGSVDAALELFAVARGAAEASGDERTEGVVRKDLANVLSEAGRNDEAVVELGRARQLLHAAGDVREEAFVLMMLGSRFVDDGRLEEARRDLGAALALLRETGDRRSEAWTLLLLALADAEAGATSSARRQLDRAIALVREVGDEHTEGLLLGYLGNVALEQGLLADAESAYRDAIVRLARASDRASEGFFTAAAAVVEHALGRHPAATDAARRARELVKDDGRAARREAVEILAGLVDGAGTTRPRAERPAEEVRFAERVVALAPSRAGASRDDGPGLVVASDGSWVRTASKQVAKLGAGRPIARVMLRLALERMRHPGRPVPPQSLVRAGWPGERVLPAAAKNRLHVTIARLRRVALEGALLHDDDGYFLDPATAARVADPGEPPA
ncbi:MAG: AAA family ATPase [Labilithrix sp.]|nr:AAA family ATPase [Labilithrix sp.]